MCSVCRREDMLGRSQAVSARGCQNPVRGFGFRLDDLQAGLRRAGEVGPDPMLSESGGRSSDEAPQ